MWLEAGPVAGTLAETHLCEIRGIPAPVGGWPFNVLRWHAPSSSLLVSATRANGAVQEVQRVRMGGDATNATNSQPAPDPHDGAWVRLPGVPTGPLLLAEGLEVGLSVWRATGAETCVSLGSLAKAELPLGRRVVICADDLPRRAKKGKAANAAKRLKQAVARWRKANVDVVVAYPWPVRRGDKSDFNDVIRAEGIEAVFARIETALSPPAPAVARVSVDQARAELAATVGAFMAAAAAWAPPGDDTDDDEARPALPPPVHAIRVDVGAGKSEATRRGLVRLVARMRARGDNRSVAIAVPTLALGGEQAQELIDMPEALAAGLVVRVWRGRDAGDPDAPRRAMCRDLPAVTLAQELALDVQTTACRRKLRDGTMAECRHVSSCGYQRQRQAQADIWIVTHPLLFSRKSAALGELAAVVVDEGFWQAGIVSETAFALDALDPHTLPDDLALAPLPGLRRLSLDVLRAHDDGPVLRERFLAQGLSEAGAVIAHRLEWGRLVKPSELVPGMSAEARRAAASAARGNRLVLRLARFWRALRALLADGGPEASGWLTVARDDDDVRVVRHKGRRDVAKGWRVPTLILDATLRLETVRPFYPQARLVADLAVAAPHQHVRQVTDRAYSLAMLDPEGTDDPEDRRRRENRLRDLRVTIETEARRMRPRRLLVVAQKRIEEAQDGLGPMPPNVILAHHNAVAGRDEWTTQAGDMIKGGELGGLVVVGRTLPSPAAVGDLAEALSGSHTPLLDGWYQRADAIRETVDGAELAEADRHPDPLAEAIRWQIVEGQLVQIVGRGRGVNRTEANPLSVLLLCDVPLPLPVAETIPDAALDPTLPERMLAEGGVALENSRHALQAYPGMWPSKDAARQAFLREKWATFPYEESLLGKCRSLRRVAYQVARQGQREAVAWFDELVVPDPEAWLAGRLGPLASCCVASRPPPNPPGVGLVPEAALFLAPGLVDPDTGTIAVPAMESFIPKRVIKSVAQRPSVPLVRPPSDDPWMVARPSALPDRRKLL